VGTTWAKFPIHISDSHFIVIASEAKQSISPPKEEWIASLRSQ
jgi:uncharacterized protein YktB (UPF0637 family)